MQRIYALYNEVAVITPLCRTGSSRNGTARHLHYGNTLAEDEGLSFSRRINFNNLYTHTQTHIYVLGFGILRVALARNQERVVLRV